MAKLSHGMSKTRPYSIWLSILQRCQKSHCSNYKHYGGRGIGIDPSWEDFVVFWNDMKEGYLPNLQIDRIDNDLGYSKSNCRWVTPKQQQVNKRNNRWIEFGGKKMTLSQWAEHIGITQGGLFYRLKRMGIEAALSTPNPRWRGFDFGKTPPSMISA